MFFGDFGDHWLDILPAEAIESLFQVLLLLFILLDRRHRYCAQSTEGLSLTFTSGRAKASASYSA